MCLGKIVKGALEYDSDALDTVLMDEAKHRVRSHAAELASAEVAAKYPLPVGAQGGGNKAADPLSWEERGLTERTLPSSPSQAALHCVPYVCSASRTYLLMR